MKKVKRFQDTAQIFSRPHVVSRKVWKKKTTLKHQHDGSSNTLFSKSTHLLLTYLDEFFLTRQVAGLLTRFTLLDKQVAKNCNWKIVKVCKKPKLQIESRRTRVFSKMLRFSKMFGVSKLLSSSNVPNVFQHDKIVNISLSKGI